jgi:hypothetical protein
MLRNGGTVVWSDAIYPLSDFLKRTSATQVMPVDWGMFDNLLLLNRGKLPLRVGGDPLNKPVLDAADRETVRQWLITPGTIFVAHTGANQIFPGTNERLDGVARECGLVRESMGRFADSNGRPIYEVLRYKDR